MSTHPRKRGRPRVDSPMIKLHVRMPDVLLRGIDAQAAEMHCPRTTAMRALLARALRDVRNEILNPRNWSRDDGR